MMKVPQGALYLEALPASLLAFLLQFVSWEMIEVPARGKFGE